MLSVPRASDCDPSRSTFQSWCRVWAHKFSNGGVLCTSEIQIRDARPRSGTAALEVSLGAAYVLFAEENSLSEKTLTSKPVLGLCMTQSAVVVLAACYCRDKDQALKHLGEKMAYFSLQVLITFRH